MPKDNVENLEEVARLVNNTTKVSHERALNNNKQRPARVSRPLDTYLNSAYQEHSSNPVGWCRDQWKYWGIMLSLGVANSSDASEILCLSYIMSDAAFLNNILRNSNWGAGMLAAAVFAGMLLGGLVVGTLGDWKGRKNCLLFGLVLNTTAGFLSACAPNVFILVGLRMVAGLGIGASIPPLFTLVAELAPPSRRGFCVTLCASFWMVGSIFVALAALTCLKNDSDGTDPRDVSQLQAILRPADWRLFAFVCAVPSAMGSALVFWLVPESPRFLALRGRFEEATLAANRLGASLKYTGPPLEQWEIEERFFEASRSTVNYHPSNSFDGEGLDAFWFMYALRWFHLVLVDFSVSASKLYTLNLRQTTLPLQMVWFSLSFGSYGLMTWINTLFFAIHLEDVYFNALLFASANLPGNLLTAFLMDRTGRTKLLVGSILSASVSLLAFAAFASTPNGTSDSIPPNTLGVVLSACTFQCFTIAAWNTIDVMTSELFPTTVRSTGMGMCAASGRVGAMIAQFVNGALVGRPVRLLVVASITLSVGAITPFLLPQHGDMNGLALAEDCIASHNNENCGVEVCDGEELEDMNFESDDGIPSVQEGDQDHKLTPSGLSRRMSPFPNDPGPYQNMTQ